MLSDRDMPAGVAKGHYFHQDLWAARKIFAANPKHHIDVGSRVDGFIAHLLTFRSVTILDVRPIITKVKNLVFIKADVMKDISPDVRSESVSCLHALEHFGLGRYGDPIDLDGWKKGLNNLAQITTLGGHLYVSVPIGNEQCIEFNAQRIFSPETIPNFASSLNLELISFSWINDNGDFIEEANLEDVTCDFGCGCYIFCKLQ